MFVDRPILATQDMDLLPDIQSRLPRAVETDQSLPPGLLDIIRKADRSFALHEGQLFRAVNKEGYLVDLAKPEPRSVMAVERRRMGEAGDIWLLSKYETSNGWKIDTQIYPDRHWR